MAHAPRSPSPLHVCQNMADSPRSDLSDSSSATPELTLTLHLHGRPIEMPFFGDEAPTLQDLSDAVADELHIPAAHQKFLITPKTGLLKPPFKDPSIPLHSLAEKKIVLMGATSDEARSLADESAARSARRNRRREALRAGQRVRATPHRDWKRAAADARYTFGAIRPLPYLPDPARSARFLQRLADDAGIRAAMRRHRFAVGLLTEMDPAAHTTHHSRTLGLNRNRGEAIELRLRTDAGDGYRDYRVIRHTLCHELAHNVWGPHDRNFWNLCREIEAEVERNDWRSGGHSVGNDEFYNPADQGMGDDDADAGGWIGGEYTLGTGAADSQGGVASSTAEPLTRREIMARAAEERMRRFTNEVKPPPSPPPGSEAKDGEEGK